ncbi:MAG: hypothetical protein OXI38_08430, partial [Bacteroidota bacterium]|nr:hypothetical protein [Bacteroidota bacterium]
MRLLEELPPDERAGEDRVGVRDTVPPPREDEPPLDGRAREVGRVLLDGRAREVGRVLLDGRAREVGRVLL